MSQIYLPHRRKAFQAGGLSFVAHSADTDTTGTLTIARPTGTADGDLMLLILAKDDDNGIGIPSGSWTAIDSDIESITMEMKTYYREASSEPANYTATQDTTTSTLVGHILTFRKPSGTWTAPTTAGRNSLLNTGGTATSLTTGSVTLPADDDFLVCVWANDGARARDTDPSGMTITEEVSAGSFSQVAYYEQRANGAVTAAQSYTIADNIQATALVVTTS